MPARHEKKQYIVGGIYHIFNRGMDRRDIFKSTADYLYFERCLITYLSPPEFLADRLQYSSKTLSPKQINDIVIRSGSLKNYSKSIDLLAYCIMPNHFHLLIQQWSARAIIMFMKSLQTKYAMYSSKKYDRQGPLLQGRYKGIHVRNEAYFNTVMDYIHNNPVNLNRGRQNPAIYLWSSYRDYLGIAPRPWLKITNL